MHVSRAMPEQVALAVESAETPTSHTFVYAPTTKCLGRPTTVGWEWCKQFAILITVSRSVAAGIGMQGAGPMKAIQDHGCGSYDENRPADFPFGHVLVQAPV